MLLCSHHRHIRQAVQLLSKVPEAAHQEPIVHLGVQVPATHPLGAFQQGAEGTGAVEHHRQHQTHPQQNPPGPIGVQGHTQHQDQHEGRHQPLPGQRQQIRKPCQCSSQPEHTFFRHRKEPAAQLFQLQPEELCQLPHGPQQPFPQGQRPVPELLQLPPAPGQEPDCKLPGPYAQPQEPAAGAVSPPQPARGLNLGGKGEAEAYKQHTGSIACRRSRPGGEEKALIEQVFHALRQQPDNCHVRQTYAHGIGIQRNQIQSSGLHSVPAGLPSGCAAQVHRTHREQQHTHRQNPDQGIAVAPQQPQGIGKLRVAHHRLLKGQAHGVAGQLLIKELRHHNLAISAVIVGIGTGLMAGNRHRGRPFFRCFLRFRGGGFIHSAFSRLRADSISNRSRRLLPGKFVVRQGHGSPFGLQQHIALFIPEGDGRHLVLLRHRDHLPGGRAEAKAAVLHGGQDSQRLHTAHTLGTFPVKGQADAVNLHTLCRDIRRRGIPGCIGSEAQAALAIHPDGAHALPGEGLIQHPAVSVIEAGTGHHRIRQHQLHGANGAQQHIPLLAVVGESRHACFRCGDQFAAAFVIEMGRGHHSALGRNGVIQQRVLIDGGGRLIVIGLLGLQRKELPVAIGKGEIHHPAVAFQPPVLHHVSLGVLDAIAHRSGLELVLGVILLHPAVQAFDHLLGTAAQVHAGIAGADILGIALKRALLRPLQQRIQGGAVEPLAGQQQNSRGAGQAHQQECRAQCHRQEFKNNVVLHLAAPSILYPWPQTTLRYRGSEGLISIFSRRCRMWTATAPSLPRAASCHTAS